MSLSPIVLFVYNRLEHTRKTVEALQKNTLAKDSELYVFADGPILRQSSEGQAKVKEVRNYIKTITGFKKIEIILRNENFGLSKSIVSGVTNIVNKYGKVIVLEDDLVTSPYFLEYMNDALDLYLHEESVVSIHGYIYPAKENLPETFFLKGADCWGWATWKRGWNIFEPDGKKLLSELENKNLLEEFDFNGSYSYSKMLKRQINGKSDSWAVRWYASAFLKNKLTLYPGKSLVNNIGQDLSGTHSKNSEAYRTIISENKVNVLAIPVTEDVKARKVISSYFESMKPKILKRIINKIFKN